MKPEAESVRGTEAPTATGPEDLAAARENLATWLEASGLAGYDPYDILGHPLYLWLSGTPRRGLAPKAIIARLASSAAYRTPLATRRLLGVRPAVNAKGVGLLLAAWLRSAVLGDPRADARAREAAEWLVAHPTSGYPGTSWGYPFDWQSRIFIPKGTPSAVVTSTCAHALLDYAETTGDKKARTAAHGAAQFLATGLNRYEASDGSICLSYTPLDDFRVHNASLMAGEYLLRASRAFRMPEWEELSRQILAYTLGDQADDGSFEYWGPGQRVGAHVDHYHTGFVLRSLAAYADAGVSTAAEALRRGWEYYAAHFFGDGGRPLDLAGRLLPLNVHSCAEAVLCPAVLSDRVPGALRLAHAAASWTVSHLSNPDGSFGYMLREDGIDATPYLRWGEAWMFLALATLLLAERRAASVTGATKGPI